MEYPHRAPEGPERVLPRGSRVKPLRSFDRSLEVGVPLVYDPVDESDTDISRNGLRGQRYIPRDAIHDNGMDRQRDFRRHLIA